jgi:hypothetical protein
MKRNFEYIDRRAFLRGCGASIALPFLESVAKPSQLLAAVGKAKEPMRMVCIGLNYGLYPVDFFPKETGRDYELPKLLKPLSRMRDEITVFSHLDHPGIKGGHEAVHTFLSGIMADGSKAMPSPNQNFN